MSAPFSCSNAAARSPQGFGLYQRNFHTRSRAAVACLLLAASSLVQAASAPFTASVDGVSQILEVIDPNGPVVRVQTLAFGSGSPGSLTYRSGDIIKLGNGQGSGTNSFTTADGDQLFGSFNVQLVPGADPSLFDLIGQVLFTGGTGDFLGASGTATFIAHGQFISASEARTQFEFEGLLATVPEPGTAVLGLLGLLALALHSVRGRLGNLTGGALISEIGLSWDVRQHRGTMATHSHSIVAGGLLLTS